MTVTVGGLINRFFPVEISLSMNSCYSIDTFLESTCGMVNCTIVYKYIFKYKMHYIENMTSIRTLKQSYQISVIKGQDGTDRTQKELTIKSKQSCSNIKVKNILDNTSKIARLWLIIINYYCKNLYIEFKYIY